MNPKNRWLILTQYYPPEIGAPQIRLRSVARELCQHGLGVEILTAMPNYPAGRIFSGYAGRWQMREEIDGMPVIRVWIFAGTGRSPVVRLANYLSFTATALWRALTGPRPDVMFIESQPLSLGLVGIIMKYLRGVPYVYNVPDLQIDVARQLGFMTNARLLKLAFGLENYFLRNSWKVSTVTHEFIKHFESRGIPSSQLTFLPNGADTEFLKPRPPSQEMLQRWGLAHKKVFVYVGTHAYYHGLDTLVEAARLLREESSIAFLLVGDGPERSRLRKIAADNGLTNVVFGDSPYEEMDQLYSIAYASIATLRNIAVSKSMRLSKVIPSLSCAVPVIYSGMGEAATLIEENCCGLVVPPESPEQLRDAVLRLSSDRGLRDRLGEAGKQLVVRDYSWSTIISRWLGEIGLDGRAAEASASATCYGQASQ